MSGDDLQAALAASLEDHRLSRSERQALASLFADAEPARDPRELRRLAFSAANDALKADGAVVPAALAIVGWLEDVVKVIDQLDGAPKTADVAEAHFSPGDDCRLRIAQLFDSSGKTVDACVFTITDDRITEAIVAAHRRGVKVRVLTDDEKAADPGSDIARLRGAGIPVRIDRTPAHMHHKFALFDGGLLLTGSYNWTRSAARENEENLIVTSDPRHVRPFARAFDRLWQRLS